MSVAALEVKQRLQRLIDEAPSVQRDDSAFRSWFLRVEIVIAGLGDRGQGRVLAHEFKEIKKAHGSVTGLAFSTYSGFTASAVENAETVRDVLAVLDAAMRAIDDGLLIALEDIVASEVYGNVFAQAEALLGANHINCAAILIRVGLEDGLKRRARHDGMPNAASAKASVVNDWLKANNVYPQGQHRQVQVWLDIGNAFAHNTPDATRYTARDVGKALEDAQAFINRFLR